MFRRNSCQQTFEPKKNFSKTIETKNVNACIKRGICSIQGDTIAYRIMTEFNLYEVYISGKLKA